MSFFLLAGGAPSRRIRQQKRNISNMNDTCAEIGHLHVESAHHPSQTDRKLPAPRQAACLHVVRLHDVRLGERAHRRHVRHRDAHVQRVPVYHAPEHAAVLPPHPIQRGRQLELPPGGPGRGRTIKTETMAETRQRKRATWSFLFPRTL